MATLSDEDVRNGLAGLPGWEGSPEALSKEFRLGDFRTAVAFVVGLSYEAEVMNHHPDIDIRYNRVRVVLSTHSEGGVTAKDLELAAAIEKLAAPAR